MNNLRLEKYYKLEEVVKSYWIALEKKVKIYPFQSYSWNESWVKTIGKNKKYKIIIVILLSGEITTAIFPFCIEEKYKLKELKLIGTAMNDYNYPIFSSLVDESDLNDLWEYAISSVNEYDLINISRVPEYDLQGRKTIFTNSFRKERFRAPELLLNRDWKLNSKGKIKTIIRTNKRKRNQLNKIGKYRFDILQSQKDCLNALEVGFSQKKRRYEETNVPNILEDSSTRDFYKYVAVNLGDRVKKHLSALWLDDVMIAFHLGFISDNIFYWYFPTFEAGEWGRYSPGSLILEELCNLSYDQKIKIFDFTIGDEGYKYYWNNSNKNLYNLLRGHSLKGKAFATMIILVDFLKSIRMLKLAFKYIKSSTTLNIRNIRSKVIQ